MAQNSVPGCFKYGCIGCGVLVALFVGFVFLLGAVQMATDDTPRPEERLAERRLPKPPTPPPAPSIDERPVEVERPDGVVEDDRPDSVRIAPSPELGGVPAAGVLNLDLSVGEFVIQPGPADAPIRVEADFDANRFALEESFETADDGSWQYDVTFRPKGGWMGLMLRGGSQRGDAKVVITVPRGHPMSLRGTMGMGETTMDLGGLWLRDVDLQLEMGDHFVEFSEPTPEPLERFALEGSMGSMEIRHLGAASPRVVEHSHRMGEVLLDLKGDWRNDSEIEANFRMGEMRIWLPETARTEVLQATIKMGEVYDNTPDLDELPEDAPRLLLAARGRMGELRIEP